MEKQYQSNLKKDNMAWIKKSFCDLNPMVFSLLYKSIIRPSIEFAEPAWSPYHRGEVEALGNI